MKKPIYKYVGPDNLKKIFSGDETITLKCSLPKDFNDPYELFLTTEFNLDSEALAIYSEAIGELPQFPTTCFSKSPTVIPMWAHYAQNHEGFVLELDEEYLEKSIKKSRFKNVEYSDHPTHDFTDLIRRIQFIGKPRYTYFLQTSVMEAAYFTKTACWSYEQERRMVLAPEMIRQAGDILLLDVPKQAVSAIICGSRASEGTKEALKTIADNFHCEFYELRIGRSTATPFFVRDSESLQFDGKEIVTSQSYCVDCMEPTKADQDICNWCGVTEDLRQYAASRNAFRILDHVGHLETYIKSMNGVRAQKSDQEE